MIFILKNFNKTFKKFIEKNILISDDSIISKECETSQFILNLSQEFKKNNQILEYEVDFVYILNF